MSTTGDLHDVQLWRLRKHSGLTTTELAAAMGLHGTSCAPEHLESCEAGAARLTEREAIAAAKALGYEGTVYQDHEYRTQVSPIPGTSGHQVLYERRNA